MCWQFWIIQVAKGTSRYRHMYFRPASLPEIPFFSSGTHRTPLLLFVRMWCTSVKLWCFTFISLWLHYLCFYPRVPIKKGAHAILQKSMKANMGDLSQTAPFPCHHAHRAWLLLLVESNWNRCCINIYKKFSLKHYLICSWEMLHVEHFLWPGSQVPPILPCFLHTLCTLPVEFHINNLLFISQNVWIKTSLSFFSPDLAREHWSLKRSLCSTSLKIIIKQAGLQMLAGGSEDALPPAWACWAACGIRHSELSWHQDGEMASPPHISWVFHEWHQWGAFLTKTGRGQNSPPESQFLHGWQLPALSWYSAGVAACKYSPVLFGMSLLGY